MQRIKKGDNVQVIAGKNLGQQGKVLQILTKEDKVVVEKVNVVKRHRRPQQTASGVRQGIQEFEAPIQLSNVMLVCPHCNQASRIGFRINEDNKKVRVCKKCKQDVEA
jgi:large subunit ribosomal protein L24